MRYLRIQRPPKRKTREPKPVDPLIEARQPATPDNREAAPRAVPANPRSR